MQTWKEYYDDWTSTILEYREHVVITPRQYMGWVAECIQKVQRRSHIATGTKVIVPDSNGDYDIGDDVLEIIDVQTSDGDELMSTSVTQNQRTREQNQLGFNEQPFNFSLKRNAPYATGWGNENRVYHRHNNLLTPYPAFSSTTNVSMRYYKDFHRFSSASSQWAAWFPDDTDFDSQFMQEVPDAQIIQFDEAFQAYAAFRHYQRNNNPLYKDFFLEYKDAVETIISNIQQHFVEGPSPYNLSPLQ